MRVSGLTLGGRADLHIKMLAAAVQDPASASPLLNRGLYNVKVQAEEEKKSENREQNSPGLDRLARTGRYGKFTASTRVAQ